MANPDLEINEYKSELTEEEKVRFYWSRCMFIRARENELFQYQRGVLNENFSITYAVALEQKLSSPNGQK
jgi:hypothetical protein